MLSRQHCYCYRWERAYAVLIFKNVFRATLLQGRTKNLRELFDANVFIWSTKPVIVATNSYLFGNKKHQATHYVLVVQLFVNRMIYTLSNRFHRFDKRSIIGSANQRDWLFQTLNSRVKNIIAEYFMAL